MAGETAEPGWEPLLQFRSGAWIGVFECAVWLGDRGAPRRIVEGRYPIPLLPLLEFDREMVESAVGERMIELGCPASMCATVGVESLLRAGVGMRSVYWTELGLSWVEAGPVPVELRDVLSLLADRSWTTQRIRHRAVRQLRKCTGP